MMKWVLTILVALSVIFGIMNGQMGDVSNHAISECANAVELMITLAGSMCLWSGLMRVAQKSGLTKVVAKLLSPLTNLVFKGLDKSSYALELICMNITANMLGLGNAATPLGIAAITELNKDIPEEKKGIASNNMVMLVVLNTASIQLIPTTVATLRLKYGSANPLDILPAVWLTSILALCVGLTMAKLCNKLFPVNRIRPTSNTQILSLPNHHKKGKAV